MDNCPHCGAELPPKARACPHCGSDESTGWSEQARYDGLNLPDGEFNYEEVVGREFGGKPVKPRGLHWFWWLVALGLILLLIKFW
jgi:zinc-ribbon domain